MITSQTLSDWLYQVAFSLGSLAIISVSALATLIYVYQTKLVYPSEFPEGSRSIVDTPEKYGLKDFEEYFIDSGEGEEKIHAYGIFHKDSQSHPTVVYCHANAGNMGHRLPIVKQLYQLGANVFIFSYRGYGKSTGQPSEKGLKTDAVSVMKFVLSLKSMVNPKEIVLFGQSLGGAVAIYLAATLDFKIKALILENTFLSIPKLVPHVLPYLKHFSFLCSEKWNSEDLISDIKDIPVLFLASVNDELVPHSHMLKLYEVSPSSNTKVLTLIKGAGHNDAVLQTSYWIEFQSFWKKYIH